MAEAALGAILTVVFENIFKKIGSLIDKEVHLLEGLTEDLEELDSTVRKFQHVLRAAEMKNFKTPDTKDWYCRLSYAANKADGVLDEALDCLERDKRVCHPFTRFIFNSVAIRRRNLGEKIRSVTRKFNNLDNERSELNLEQINIKRETVSALSEVVFGREGEKQKIINILSNHANTETGPPFIYAIVGMGGIGKTTLAQLIYNDEKVVEQFDTRIWVWVSQTFHLETVMKKIIDHFEKTQFDSMETMQKRLSQLLNKKKFLLILDDIWNENQDEWNILKSSLKFGAFGSSVLLTTRGSDVASIVRAHDQHKIAVLSEDQCWHVFKESAFLELGELEVIGKQIAKKCGGLPLAAKSLGGSLRLTREVGEWEVVRDSPIWELPQEGGILPSLKLSLESLESHSRTCYTFYCVFRKGHKMSKIELIQLWMANDLIPSHQRLELENMGNKIFNDLVLKSFFQILYNPYKDDDYNVTMHDLMHDLSLSFRKDCFSLQDPDVPDKIPKQCLHLSLYSSYPSDILKTLSKSHSSLRTCIFRSYQEQIIVNNLDGLRALDLSRTYVKDLSKSIGKIKDLKYLNLSGNDYLTHLPDSIGNLTKLQTLKLQVCQCFTQLPNGIDRLVSLRLLDLCGCERLTHLPDGVTLLVNLRHLDLRECYGLTHLPNGIGNLINLKHLNLCYCSRLIQLPDGIGRLMNLRHLDLSECKKLTHLPNDITRLVNLEHLDISSSTVTQLPNGMGQLVNLRTLAWFSVGRESGQRITELQGLNHLRGSLQIWGLEHVRDAKEAEAAILKNKKNLSSLELIWEDLQGSNESTHKVEDVLEALQPPQNLNKKLVIEGYGGSVFASWMKLLENLVEIELKDCIKCECLPPLGQLPFLKRLIITGMKSLKCIGTEFYGRTDSGSNNSSSERRAIFPSLEELEFYDMPILEEWQDTDMMDNQPTDPCPCLKRLMLSRCPELTSLPSLILSFVRELDIDDCDKVIARSLSCLTSHELDGKGTNSVTSFPELEKLRIEACENLIRLWPQGMQNLTVLQELTLADCEQLELSSADFQHLIKLQKIELGRLPKLTSLPELQHLHSLRTLDISDCHNLKMLPQGLQNLTSLERLCIFGCHHDLHCRCAEDRGEYWPFIKHIPDVRLYWPFIKHIPDVPLWRFRLR